jgi:DNA-binding XRE family transcriptional regulator
LTNITIYIYDRHLEIDMKWFQHHAQAEDESVYNIVKEIREQLLMSKAELARKAGVSPLTIDRIEKGKSCRMETKRKIILALGYHLSDKDKIFPQD